MADGQVTFVRRGGLIGIALDSGSGGPQVRNPAAPHFVGM